MDVLDASYIAEQNKIASSGAWISLLEITIPGQTTLRYANNNSNIQWPSGDPETYYALSFSMDDLTVSTSGEFPTYKLQLNYVTLNSDVREQIKATGGLVGSIVRLRVVHSAHLSLATPAVDETAEILNCELNASSVVFTIGIPSLLNKRFPRDRYVPTYCRHKFGGALCQYVDPGITLTSNQISFIEGDDYNTVWVEDGGLITDIFSHVSGNMGSLINLVANESFADGVNHAGWTDNKGAADWALYQNIETAEQRIDFGAVKRHRVVSSDSPSGYSYHHEAWNLYSNVGIEQTVPVIDGASYTLSCWAFRSGGDIEMTRRIRNLDTGVERTGTSIPHSAAHEWEQLTTSFITRSGTWENIALVIRLVGAGHGSFYGVNLINNSQAVNATRYSLDGDTGFIISGSRFNDGFFLANRYHAVDDKYVRVFTEDNGMKAFTPESAGNEITITLGYADCDHTLDACAFRNNTQNYGGSPGIAGGVYG